MEAVRRGQAEADQYFPPSRVGAKQGGAARALPFCHRERGRGDHRAAVRDRSGMRVVVLQAVDEPAVDERGVRWARPFLFAEHGR